jgi:hypothetical protein
MSVPRPIQQYIVEVQEQLDQVRHAVAGVFVHGFRACQPWAMAVAKQHTRSKDHASLDQQIRIRLQQQCVLNPSKGERCRASSCVCAALCTLPLRSPSLVQELRSCSSPDAYASHRL